MTDVHARWQESFYFMKGFIPNQVPDEQIVDSVGKLQDDMISTPWTWSMGLLFHTPWLDWETTKIISMILMAAVEFATAVTVYFTLDNHLKNTVCELDHMQRVCIASIAFFLILADGSLYYSYQGGNYGVALAGLVVIAVCIHKKHPILAGILFAIAMMKPQIVALFILTAIIRKQYKVVFSAAVFGGAALMLTSVILKIAPWQLMLSETSRGNSSFRNVFLGLFDPLKTYAISSSAVIAMGMVAGIVYVCIYLFLKDSNTDNPFAEYVGAAVASLFWFYRRPYDYMAFSVVALCILCYLVQKNNRVKYLHAIAVLFVMGYADITEVIFQGVGDYCFGRYLPNAELKYGALLGSTIAIFIGLYVLWLFKDDSEKTVPLSSLIKKKKAICVICGIVCIDCILFAFTCSNYLSEKRAKTQSVVLEPNSWNSINEHAYLDTNSDTFILTDNSESEWDMVAYSGPYCDGHVWSDWIGIRAESDETEKNSSAGQLFFTTWDENKEYFRTPLDLNHTHYINLKEKPLITDTKMYAIEFHENKTVNLGRITIWDSAIQYFIFSVCVVGYTIIFELVFGFCFFICKKRSVLIG